MPQLLEICRDAMRIRRKPRGQPSVPAGGGEPPAAADVAPVHDAEDAGTGRRRIVGVATFSLIVVGAGIGYAAYVLLPAYWSPQSRAFAGPLGYPAVMRMLERPIEVQAEPVRQRSMVRMMAGEGVTAYLNNIPVHSEVPGLVTDVLVEPGHRTRLGMPLLHPNPGEHTTRLFELRQQLTDVEAELAKGLLERERKLFDANLISGPRLNGAMLSMRRAETASNLALEEYAHFLRSRSATVTGEPMPWTANRVSAQRVAINATVEGTVIERNVQIGENHIDLKKPLLVLGDRLVFRAYFDQRYAGLLREGLEGRFYLRTRPGQPIPARVLRVAHEVQAAEQRRRSSGEPPPYTFSVWLSIPDDLLREANVLPGMNGYAVFEHRYTAPALPESALIRYSGRTGTVLAVDASNQLRVEPVTYTGAEDGWVAIESTALRAGDLVVVSGHTALQAGDRVAAHSPPTLPQSLAAYVPAE